MSVAHSRLSAWVLSLACLLTPAARAQTSDGRVDLRPKFEAGQTVRLKMDVTNTSTPVVPPGAHAAPKKYDSAPGTQKTDKTSDVTRSGIELGLTLKVRSVSPQHESTVDLTFDTLKVSSKTQDQTTEFDSTKPSKGEDDVVGLLMRPLVGSTLTLKVDATGNITGVTGGEAFTALGQFVSGGGDAGGIFGPIVSPQHGTGLVHLGESWENSDKVQSPLLGEFKMTTRHTLRGVHGKDANVDLAGRIEPASQSTNGESFQIKDSRYTGKYTWDLGMGMVKSMESTMSITLDQTLDGKKTTTRNESVMHVTRVR